MRRKRPAAARDDWPAMSEKLAQKPGLHCRRKKARLAVFRVGGCASTQNEIFGFWAAVDVGNHIRNDGQEFFQFDGF